MRASADRGDLASSVTVQLDVSTEFGSRVERRLQEEIVVWLTTVRADGLPRPRPVWFHWNGETILIFSRPNAAKVRDVAGNPKVALNLDGNKRGGDIIVISGEAAIEPAEPPPSDWPGYLEKYRSRMARTWTPESFRLDYSVPIRVTLTRLRGH
jgi:PPOX class probable F420-dependent enzyme